ncbi:MAG: hypothetical protein AB7E36_06340 [Salinivirgaceae bacterium]
MKYLNLILIMLLLGCDTEKPSDMFNLDAGVSFYVVNENGNDLLDPENENAIGYNDITIYYLVDGEKQEFYNPDLDSPKGFSIFEPEGLFTKYNIGLGLNTKGTEKITTTLIEWYNTEVDTIKAEIERGDNYAISTKIWFNDIVVWDVNNPELSETKNGSRFFQIVK